MIYMCFELSTSYTLSPKGLGHMLVDMSWWFFGSTIWLICIQRKLCYWVHVDSYVQPWNLSIADECYGRHGQNSGGILDIQHQCDC